MKFLYNYFKTKSNAKFITIAVSSFIILTVLIQFLPFGVQSIERISRGSASILDNGQAFSVDKSYDILTRIGSRGRAMSIWFYVLDFIYPLSISFTFVLLFVKIYDKKINAVPLAKFLVYFSLAYIIFDYGENICALTMITHYPLRLNIIASARILFTTFKFVFIVIMFLFLISGLIYLFIKRRNKT